MDSVTKQQMLRRYRIAKKLAALREARKPMTGPYYWVPTPNGWDLYIYPEEAYPAKIHDYFWRTSVVPMLVEEWNLDPSLILDLKKLPFSVPRGRVSRENIYYLNHGDDTPVPDGLKKVISEMNLGGMLRSDRLEIIEDDEKKMIPFHRETLVRLIPDLSTMMGA